MNKLYADCCFNSKNELVGITLLKENLEAIYIESSFIISPKDKTNLKFVNFISNFISINNNDKEPMIILVNFLDIKVELNYRIVASNNEATKLINEFLGNEKYIVVGSLSLKEAYLINSLTNDKIISLENKETFLDKYNSKYIDSKSKEIKESKRILNSLLSPESYLEFSGSRGIYMCINYMKAFKTWLK